jgi:hypothetical protein
LNGGGLFDWRRNWSVPHTLHRVGKDIDFDDPVLELAENRQIMEDFCDDYRFEGVATTCQVHDESHFHAFVGSTHYHR